MYYWTNIGIVLDDDMETFSALMAFCAGGSLVAGGFSTQRLVTRSFEI